MFVINYDIEFGRRFFDGSQLVIQVDQGLIKTFLEVPEVFKGHNHLRLTCYNITNNEKIYLRFFVHVIDKNIVHCILL